MGGGAVDSDNSASPDSARDGTTTADDEGAVPGEDGGSERTPDSDRTETAGRTGSSFDRYEQLTLVRAVVAIAVLAVVLRLVALGARPAHWDEARVAYWAYFYDETGSLAYYWEEHGPFAQIVAANLFDVFGVNDFTTRLPVALVGGLLPLGALLYRKHLYRTETVALALLLAVNSVLLYYSRFMRSDVLVAAFMFVALGCLVRFYDTRKARYVLAAGVFLGFGFGSKENAVIYLVTWAGAVALLVDQFLHSPAGDGSGLDYLRANVDAYRNRLREAVYRADYAIGLVVTFVVTMVALFAPRGRGLDRRLDPDSTADPVTLGDAVRNPLEIPTLVDESLGEAYSGYVDWFSQSEETTFDTYVSFLGDYVTLLVEYAPLVTSFAVVGIVIERYARDRPRALVMFLAYCGVASLIGYPLGSHIEGDSAWLSVHVIVPLLVPAAVGLAWGYRQGRQFVRRESINPVVVVVFLVVLVGLWAWFIPVQSVYVDNTAPENGLVQYAQPYSDLDPLVDTMDEVAAGNDGTGVVLYYGETGERFDANAAPIRKDITDDFTGDWQVQPLCSSWGTSQPLNWYFATTDVTVDCERSPDALSETVSEEVPVVITVPDDSTVPTDALDGSYVEQSYYLRSYGQEVVVYTHSSWADQS